MECSQCKASFSPEISSNTGLINCVLYCPPNCYHCFVNSTNGTVCDMCNDGFSLAKDSSCVVIKDCAVAKYFDPNKQVCANCPSNCSKCYWDDNVKYARCAWCQTGFKLTTDLLCRQKINATEASCPATFFEDSTVQECKKCPDKCTVCAISSAVNQALCRTCSFGFVVDTLTGGCI